MKRFMLAVLFVLISCSTAFSAATALPDIDVEYKVWNKGVEYKTVYTSLIGSSVPASDEGFFKLDSRSSQGKIVGLSFESDATSWEILINGVDNDQVVATSDTHAGFDHATKTFDAPIVLVPIRWFNTAGEDFYYVSIINTDAVNATGIWVLTITTIRY
jgi:hypothetical protein